MPTTTSDRQPAQWRAAMRTASRSCLALAAVAWLAGSTVAWSQALGPTANVFQQREQWMAEFDQMPQAGLRAYFLRCEQESRSHLLDMQAAVQCAMAWDALLRRAHGGNVEALLAWWRDSAGPARQDAGTE